MAHSETTLRRATYYNERVNDYLTANCPNYRGTLWDPLITGAGPYSIDNTKNAIKNAFISAMEAEEASAQWSTGWNFVRDAGNPLLTKPLGGSGSECYPPNMIEDGVVDRLICKSDDNKPWGWTTSNGTTFAENGNLMPRGAVGDWDHIVAAPQVLKKIGSIYHMLYTGYQNSGVPTQAIGHASVNTWGNQFVENVANPIWTVAQYNAISGDNKENIWVEDAVYIPATGKWWFFGIASYQNFIGVSLIYGIGDTIDDVRLDTKICDGIDLHYSESWIQSPQVFKHPVTGKWMMTVSLGVQGGGTDKQCQIAAYSQRTDLPIFTLADFKIKPILEVVLANNWENRQVYAARWLKDNEGNLILRSGNYLYYYSGHGDNIVYTGVVCLARISSIPQI